MALTADEIESFRSNGFLSVPRLVDDATVERLRIEYDRFLSREIDCGEDDRYLGGLTRQVKFPSRYNPNMQDNPATQAGIAIGHQVFECDDCRVVFDMLISKEAGNLNETPWHQDKGYWGMPFAAEGTPIGNTTIQVWIPLDDVDEDNGCMQFIPKSHLGNLLPHYVASGDPTNEGRLLATDSVDPRLAVACPLKAGGCTLHFEGTLHYTGPNATKDRGRRAYIFTIDRKH